MSEARGENELKRLFRFNVCNKSVSEKRRRDFVKETDGEDEKQKYPCTRVLNLMTSEFINHFTVLMVQYSQDAKTKK